MFQQCHVIGVSELQVWLWRRRHSPTLVQSALSPSGPRCQEELSAYSLCGVAGSLFGWTSGGDPPAKLSYCLAGLKTQDETSVWQTHVQARVNLGGGPIGETHRVSCVWHQVSSFGGEPSRDKDDGCTASPAPFIWALPHPQWVSVFSTLLACNGTNAKNAAGDLRPLWVCNTHTFTYSLQARSHYLSKFLTLWVLQLNLSILISP